MKRHARSAAIVVAAFLVSSGTPAAVSGPVREDWPRHIAKSAGVRSLYVLLPDEASRHALDQLLSRWSGGTSVVGLSEDIYTRVTHDMSGDDRPDILAVRHSYGLPETTHIRSQVIALDGATGERLWTSTAPENATSYPVEARVGREGKSGFIVVHLSGFDLMTDELVYTIRALNDRGTELWRREFRSTIVGYWPIQYVATNYVVGFDTFDGLPGPATDVLIGSGSVVVPGIIGIESGVIDAYVINGATGELTQHLLPAVGFAGVPRLHAFGDFDGDDLDDYVFTSTGPPVQLADGDTPPQVSPAGGVVTGRAGTDGQILWSTVGFDFFQQNIFFTDRRDVIGNPAGDAFVETNPIYGAPEGARERTYLIDGRDGLLVWKRPGQWPFSPGDVDGDGGADLLLLSQWSADGYHGTWVWAITTSGKKIWKRRYLTKDPPATCCSWLWHFDGSWGVGDVNGDALTDAYFDNHTGGFGSSQRQVFIIDPDNGGILASGDLSLRPLIRSIDADGSADLALVSGGAAGHMSMRVLEGETRRTLLADEIVFALPADAKAYDIDVHTARLTDDECPEILLTVQTPNNIWEIVLDGGSGKILWAIPFIRENEAAPRLEERADRNTHC